MRKYPIENLEQKVETLTRLEPTLEQNLLAEDFTKETFKDWQEAFWLARYIEEFCNQESSFDKVLMFLFDEALNAGLTYNSNKPLFLKASLSLAKLQFKYKNYRQAENQLLLLRELSDDPKQMPNWINQYSTITYYKLNLPYITNFPLEFFESFESISDISIDDQLQKTYILKDFINDLIEYSASNSRSYDRNSDFFKSFEKHLQKWLRLVDDEWSELTGKTTDKKQINVDLTLPKQDDDFIELIEQKNNEIKSLHNLVEVFERNNRSLQNKIDELSKISLLNDFEKVQSELVIERKKNTDLTISLLGIRQELEKSKVAITALTDTRQNVMNGSGNFGDIQINQKPSYELIIEKKESEIQNLNNIVVELSEKINNLKIQLSTYQKSDVDLATQLTNDISGSLDYSVRKRDLKILLFGASEVKANDLYKIAKSFGLARNQIVLRTDYEKNKSFDIRNIQYSSVYSAILIGPVSHNSKNMGDYSSLVSSIQNDDGYPPSIVLRDANGELKVTNTNFKIGLKKILTKLKASNLA